VLALLFRNTNIHIHRRWRRNDELVTAPGGILRERWWCGEENKREKKTENSLLRRDL